MGQLLASPTDTPVNAELYTKGILVDLESVIDGDPAMAVAIGNSALAAVKIIFAKYGIKNEDSAPVFHQIWDRIVEESLAA